MRRLKNNTSQDLHFSLRKATADDIAALAAIEREVFAGEAWTEAMFRPYLDAADALFLVAEPVGTAEPPNAGDVTAAPVAYVILLTVAGEGYIDNVCVAPSYRCKGLAKRMLTEAMHLARAQHGATAFTLECRASNAPARTLYESLGFVYEGARPGYYTHPREDAAIYWLR